MWADALVEWLGVTERDMLLVNAGKDLEGLRGRLPGLGAASATLSPTGAPRLGPARPLSFVIVSYSLVGKLAAVLAGDAADSGSGSSGGGGRGRGRAGRGGVRRRGGRERGPPAVSPFGMVVCDESHYLKDYKVCTCVWLLRACLHQPYTAFFEQVTTVL